MGASWPTGFSLSSSPREPSSCSTWPCLSSAVESAAVAGTGGFYASFAPGMVDSQRTISFGGGSAELAGL
jgi:hypothetical protein